MSRLARLVLVVDGRAEDEALIARMAADLRRLGVTSSERDAIRALSELGPWGGYRLGDIAALAGKALYAAQQQMVAEQFAATTSRRTS